MYFLHFLILPLASLDCPIKFLAGDPYCYIGRYLFPFTGSEIFLVETKKWERQRDRRRPFTFLLSNYLDHVINPRGFVLLLLRWFPVRTSPTLWIKNAVEPIVFMLRQKSSLFKFTLNRDQTQLSDILPQSSTFNLKLCHIYLRLTEKSIQSKKLKVSSFK